MAAVQNVEHTIGKYQRTRKLHYSRIQGLRRTELVFEVCLHDGTILISRHDTGACAHN